MNTGILVPIDNPFSNLYQCSKCRRFIRHNQSKMYYVLDSDLNIVGIMCGGCISRISDKQ